MEFTCGRFPSGRWPINTAAGLVEFVDGRAEVDDRDLAAALHEVDASFEIGGPPVSTQDEPTVKPPAQSEVRRWAVSEGIAVPKKGRIAPAVVERYLEAHRG